MRLLGAGRECDVFDLGDGTVLRRRRSGKSASDEAAAMTWARGHGYPCPAVHRADGPDLVLDLVAAPTRLDLLLAEPSVDAARAAGEELADLHRRLHDIPAPDGNDGCLVHLDLHPANVLVTPDGPVVIDWTNARNGPAGLDLAMTWAIIEPFAATGFPAAVALLEAFLDGVGREEARLALPEAGRQRLTDRNTTDDERVAVQALLDRERDR